VRTASWTQRFDRGRISLSSMTCCVERSHVFCRYLRRQRFLRLSAFASRMSLRYHASIRDSKSEVASLKSPVWERRMRSQYRVEDITIHRIVEQEYGFAPIRDFFPSLSSAMLEENRSWLAPAALDPTTDDVILCFQSYVVKTPHHTVLVDTCIG